MAGLLDFDPNDPRQAGMMNLWLGLLQAGGPSPVRNNWGAAIGQAGQAGLGAYRDTQKFRMLQEQQAKENALKEQELALRKLQVENARKPVDDLINAGGGNIYQRSTGQWITPPKAEATPEWEPFEPPFPMPRGQKLQRSTRTGEIKPIGQGEFSPVPQQFTFLQSPQGFMPANARTGQVGAPVGETFPRGGAGGEKTPAQDAVDRAFAKEYVEFTAGGGYADVEKNLTQLRMSAEKLADKDTLTGPIRGRLPDFVREITNPKAIDVRDSVTESVQRNLRLILGAQFTEKEGERLIARAYNSNLDDATNIRRVNALVKQIEDAARTKLDAIRYYEQNGTIRGWNGRQPTMADFEAAIENAGGSSGRGAQQQSSGPVKINSDADYNALPSGAEFIAPDGTRRRKP